MEIRVDRQWKKADYTISMIFIDGKRFGDGQKWCSILEDKDRGLSSSMSKDEIAKAKVYGKTAIPTGRYRVTITYSNAFKKMLPLLNGVPGYEGIRIHSGNSAADTSGCLLPGCNDKPGWVSNSRYWFNRLYDIIDKAIKGGDKVYITIG